MSSTRTEWQAPSWLVTLVEVLRWGTGLALLAAIAYYYPTVFMIILRVLAEVLAGAS